MNREYHKRYSSELHREIEMLVLGHGGMPLLVFPTSQGRFYEYEDRGMSGAYDIHQFLDGYYDNDCYFNCPPDFLPNMNDEWFLSRYRQMRIVLASGEWDMCLDANVKLSAMLHAKGVPRWLDVWGDHTGHDWPWWVRMEVKYFG